ncbi:methylated-DNA--[protein]-cysteine S-methyltransferase [Eggerthellaceae bacterium zg-1084]|uniref:Methylated-DNA--[protein]-cysteine S-methyltransferase n=1 Tax=Berryella wangjianweii TaxID=2734634 RepID=A0A6M8J262_9ACTN|nr:methylated-DNA--[protein]-cysteine S-methyltransferase [Berryella wangjianweii]NPD31232.1 methylated-DNA--[protein]-cysteine S-methyltransferase [Berryella wangjianweii]NPD32459.1 methylated-DNA--[protein]-cysteine S-methyltransferase [Eggerthellaceae bacterium zg-997]QKF06783.1 methylated-DNA--[protein]-cysteine S-methyltransferase [Berryella wangjianweii]
MPHVCHHTYATPRGPITLAATDRGICRVAFGAHALEGHDRPTALLNDAATQVQQYLAGRRRAIDLPLDLQATPFQRRVWQAVMEIPYADERTCAQIAAAMGRPSAHRSVGSAVRACPVPLVVPVHRVVRADSAAHAEEGRLGRALRQHERRMVRQQAAGPYSP